MILIAHRGNLKGPNPLVENSPSYIFNALDFGFEAEVDLWRVDGVCYLGHDEPCYRVDEEFLNIKGLWIHLKNLEAVTFMRGFNRDLHWFWHESDRMTLTSKGVVWLHSGEMPIKDCVLFKQTPVKEDFNLCFGICSDYVLDIKREILFDRIKDKKR
jgi:hypothetical protein